MALCACLGFCQIAHSPESRALGPSSKMGIFPIYLPKFKISSFILLITYVLSLISDYISNYIFVVNGKTKSQLRFLPTPLSWFRFNGFDLD